MQWTNAGVDQFLAPKRVDWASEDGQYARVLGSPAGLLMSELTVTPAPVTTKVATPKTDASDENQIEVFVAAGGRLQISADVDKDGLAKLKTLLNKYEEILDLL